MFFVPKAEEGRKRGIAKKANISKTVPVTPVHYHDHDHGHNHDQDRFFRDYKTLDQHSDASLKNLFFHNVASNFLLFLPFFSFFAQKQVNSRFGPALGLQSTQMLVKLYITHFQYSFIPVFEGLSWFFFKLSFKSYPHEWLIRVRKDVQFLQLNIWFENLLVCGLNNKLACFIKYHWEKDIVLSWTV